MSASVAIRFNAITGDAEKAFTNLTRTVSGFEKSFAGMASSVQGHQERMNKAFEQFSGDKLIREANELARAIEKVGGASKLTESEQKQVNATLTEAISKYRALGLEAPKAMTDLANATAKLEQPTTLASKAAGILSSAFGQFTLANLASTAINNIVGKLGEFVAQGAKLPGLSASFDRLASGVGENSAEMLAALQTATRGMVADIDLMQSANKALLLGLPVTTQEMGDLAKTATVLGKAMGLDATQSLNDLITALGRSSPLILDNLGLTVKVGEANDAYAAKLGKTSDQLTDAEKKTAFYQAAMEAARIKTEQLGEQTKTLGELIDTAWVAIGNRVTGVTSIVNIGLGAAISSLKNFASLIEDTAKFGFSGALGRQVASTVAPRAQVEPVSFEESIRRDAQAQAQALAALEAAAKNATAALAPLTDRQKELALQLAQGGKSAKEIADALNTVRATAGVTERQIQPLIESFKNSTRTSQQYRDSVRELSDQLAGAKLSGEVKKLSDAFHNLTSAQRQNPEVMNRVADAAIALHKSGADLTPELIRITVETGRLQDSMTNVTVGLDAAKLGFQTTSAGIKETVARLTEFIDLMNDPRLKAIEGVPANIPGFKFKIEIPEPPPPTFWQKFLPEPASFMAQARGIAQSAIGSLADAFQTGNWAQFKANIAKNVSDFMGAAIAAGVDFLIPGLGTLLQPLFSALASKVVGLFDRNRGRDLVEDFANSLGGFDALQKKLGEMGAEGDRLWRMLTQGVGRNNPDQARRAIEEVTRALAAQEQKQKDAAQASVEAAKKIQDSQNAAADTLRGRISELGAEYDRLFNSIKDEAPEEVMGIIEEQTRARMAAVREEQTATQNELDKLLKSLEDSFAGVGEAAQAAARTIEEAFNGIRIHPIDFGFAPSGGTVEVPAMAGGGIVRRPTLALVGESGPEAVVPLSQFGGADGGSMTVILESDGRQMAEIVVPYIPGVVRRYGLV